MEKRKFSISVGVGLLWLIAIVFILVCFTRYFNIQLNTSIYSSFTIVGLLVFFIAFDRTQPKHAVLRNYPLVGRLRYMFEAIRPEIRQYFFESDIDGKPFNRRQRSIVYQRAKDQKETVAFGMQLDASDTGFEWAAHSIYPIKIENKDLRVIIGNHQCSKPYLSSIFNISAMSYGALSKTAISSLNQGARMGRFAHNTGEGGISPYHLEGGDLIWQIGTGYFGCRNDDGTFNPELFSQNAGKPSIKAIELKLSQGAKPGHGGILPASKNTTEIAKIRNLKPGITVYSPPAHSAFSNNIELIKFIGLLRNLSGGKPVGFKLCIGNKQEFIDICEAIIITGIIPDFITVDGAEGGTGAAPLEFTDHLGMPMYDGLAFVSSALESFGLRTDIKIMAAGKIITGFDILKAIALGADTCYSARGMMMALGCIQALKCDSGKCPVGIATQDKKLYRGIDISDKRIRVKNFHFNTIRAAIELMEACGFKSTKEIKPDKFFRRINPIQVQSAKTGETDHTKPEQTDHLFSWRDF